MLRSKLRSTVLQSCVSKGLVRGLTAHMPCTSSLPSSSCSAVPSPHFGSVDTLRTGYDRRASAVTVDVSSGPNLPLLASKPLPMADLLASSTVLPVLACTAEDDEFSADAVDASDLTTGYLVPLMRHRLLDLMRHSIGQETDSAYNAISDGWASATAIYNSPSLAPFRLPLLGSAVRPAHDCDTLSDDSLTTKSNCTFACTGSACRHSRTNSPLHFPSGSGSIGGSDRAWAAVPPHLRWARQVRQQLVRSLTWPQSQQTQTASHVVGAVARVFSTANEAGGGAATGADSARDIESDKAQSGTLLIALV